MAPILPKHLMSEEDIKHNFITPALHAKGWKDRITMETAVKFTDGRINLRGNTVSREAPKKADYLLYQCANHPIAVVEAKDNNHSLGDGIQQAMMYAQMLGLKFAYSSNGDGFIEHDFLTGSERELALDEFPTPDELFARYHGEENPDPAVDRIRDRGSQKNDRCQQIMQRDIPVIQRNKQRHQQYPRQCQLIRRIQRSFTSPSKS